MDRLMKKLGLLALCTGLSFAVHAVTPQAEAPAEQNVKIDSVVVTGARYASDIRHLPMTVSVVGREKIEQSLQPSLLPTLTEQVPGLFTTARGIMGYGVSDGAAGGISLRGLSGGSGRLMVLIDGLVYGWHWSWGGFVTSVLGLAVTVGGLWVLMYLDGQRALVGKSADQLRQRLREELGLTISVGVSFNKIFAKLGSDYKKPDATTVIDRDNWQRIVWPLPVGDLLGVGRSTQKLLRQYGVETIGQLAAFPRETLEALMGKHGAQLHDYANGQENSPVRPQHEAEPVKSVGNGTTFPTNLTRWEQVRAGLSALADSVAGRLRRYGMYCGGVALTIRYADFRQFTRQTRLSGPAHLQKDIYRAALTLAQQAWHAPEPIRALTVTALYLTPDGESYQQLDLLAGDTTRRDEKQERLEQAMDAIRGKYGKGSITFGNTGKFSGWDD